MQMLDIQNSQLYSIYVRCSYHDPIVIMAGYMRNMTQDLTIDFLEGTWGKLRQHGQRRLAVYYISISNDELLFLQVKHQK